MKKYIFGFIMAFILVSSGLAEGELRPALDFKLRDLYNNEYTLSSYKDKQPVILFFWTTWCPFCLRELSKLNDRYLDLARYGIELLAIDVGEPAGRVDRAAKSNSLAFKILLDKDASVAEAYEVMGVPTYILIDKTNHIVSIGNSFPEDKYKQLIPK